jgi:hypothetical protein
MHQSVVRMLQKYSISGLAENHTHGEVLLIVSMLWNAITQ